MRIGENVAVIDFDDTIDVKPAARTAGTGYS